MAASTDEIKRTLISEQQLRDILFAAIKEGCINYKKYQEGSDPARNRGHAAGWCSIFHHGSSGTGQAIAMRIVFQIQKDNSTRNHVTDMLKDLDTYFSSESTQYRNHSLANYLLDELNKIVGTQPANPGRTYTKESWTLLAKDIKQLAAPEALIPPEGHQPACILYKLD